MRCTDIIFVYAETRTKLINTFYGQAAEFLVMLQQAVGLHVLTNVP